MSPRISAFCQNSVPVSMVKNELDRLNKLLSFTDKTVCNYYHMLEELELNAIELAQITKQLRVQLKLRREYKNDIAILSSVLLAKQQNKPIKSFEQFNNDVVKRNKRYLHESLAGYEMFFGKKKNGQALIKE